MSTVSKILEGISIINSYYKEDWHNLTAEHDQIYMEPTSSFITPKDLKRLVDLGWFQDSLDENDIFNTYNIEEPWQLYV